MSANSYLDNLAKDFIIKETEKEKITKSIDTIKDRLDNYFGTIIKDKILFGSYTRHTILPRKVDENSDIDLMVVFDNPNGYQPQTFLNKLKDFANYYYSTSEIYQDNPTIVLELNHIKFELVPAYHYYSNTYKIPDKNKNWMETTPKDIDDNLTDCNKNNDYKIKPVVRLIKHWNIQKNSRNLSSYKLEEKIASDMKYSSLLLPDKSYLQYVKKALEVQKNYINDKKLNEAIEIVKNAIQFEKDNMPYSAEDEIKKAFPEI